MRTMTDPDEFSDEKLDKLYDEMIEESDVDPEEEDG